MRLNCLGLIMHFIILWYCIESLYLNNLLVLSYNIYISIIPVTFWWVFCHFFKLTTFKFINFIQLDFRKTYQLFFHHKFVHCPK